MMPRELHWATDGTPMSDPNILDFMRARFDRQDEMLRRIDALLDSIVIDITSPPLRKLGNECGTKENC